ncbi:GMC family oxidoreductase [Sphingomonas crocodyli]|uniref:Glucose-methanol-choline oxidoreductase n=1 Tax=Sphingomonas crocodyli TaxID=1979270 RepID=A0A437MA83_9SPHN|nr:GMC family oxidoreductase N-terminal domain-containing protein [Sphingomonas crocodyli]RVT94549.1 glucose-methanol-choline oxidoreductase [Sphingomonas crocodyli]
MTAGYDHIVVGGGSSGCIVASRLSDDPDVRVLLVEAGRRDAGLLSTIPGMIFRVAYDPRNGWGYMTEPQAALNGRALSMTQARVLGGGSAINGMCYSRGFAHEFDHWRALGADGWSYDEVLPWFRKLERSARGGGRWHGNGGPMSVVRGGSRLGIIHAAAEAMAQAGYARLDDLSVPEPDGMGHYDWFIARGRRASTASAYPGILSHRPNLTVMADATVLRVIVEGDRAVGIEVARDRRIETIRAEGEVILSGGAINSPKLLLQSGIGDGDALKALGIPVVLDRPQVGRNLQNHTAYVLTYTVNAPVTAYNYLKPVQGAIEVAHYLFGRGGFLAEGTGNYGGFFRSDPALSHPDFQLFVAGMLRGERRGPLGLLPDRHGFALGINEGRPKSRGEVRLRSADPFAPPVIDPRYFEDARDMEALIDATLRMRELAAQPALATLIEAEVGPGPAVTSRAQIAKHIRATVGNHYHVCGTCRMGSDADAVTDPQLRVKGIGGLRVADMSVAPELVNGNTGAAAMMIGERAAALVAGRGIE